MSRFQMDQMEHIKRMDNNHHIPDLVHAFYYAENGGLNLLLYCKIYKLQMISSDCFFFIISGYVCINIHN